MNVVDYGRSFLAGKADFNQVRFQVESRTRLIDERSGECADYWQCASCKSEDTFAERDLFYEDNYDFLPAFGPEWGVVWRRHGCLNEDYRSVRPSVQLWDGQDCHIVECPHARLLESNELIRAASAAWEPIVARVEFSNEQTQLRAIIECPVKTLNARAKDNVYQVDTGPLVVPDLQRHERPPEGFALGFVAFSRPDWADFVLEVPTEIGSDAGTCRVYHYSRRLTVKSVNSLYAVPVQ